MLKSPLFLFSPDSEIDIAIEAMPAIVRFANERDDKMLIVGVAE
jgi:hypothetical protein